MLFARECATTVRIPKTLKSLFLLERRTKRRLPLFLAIVATRLHDGLIILVRDRSFPSPPDHGDGFDERRRRLYIEAAVCRAGIVGEEARSLRGYLARRILGEGGSDPRDLRGQKR